MRTPTLRLDPGDSLTLVETSTSLQVVASSDDSDAGIRIDIPAGDAAHRILGPLATQIRDYLDSTPLPRR